MRDGHVLVRAASVDGLVWILLDVNYIERDYCDWFLFVSSVLGVFGCVTWFSSFSSRLTYCYFMDSFELLAKLLERWSLGTKERDPEWRGTFRSIFSYVRGF
jgi:hypothetical protein